MLPKFSALWRRGKMGNTVGDHARGIAGVVAVSNAIDRYDNACYLPSSFAQTKHHRHSNVALKSKFQNFSASLLLAIFVLSVITACVLSPQNSVNAQRPQFADPFQLQNQAAGFVQGAGQNLQNVGQTIINSPGNIAPPPAVLQQPVLGQTIIGQPNFAPGQIINQTPVINPPNFSPTGSLPGFGQPNFAPSTDPFSPNQAFPIFPRATQPNPTPNQIYAPPNAQPIFGGQNPSNLPPVLEQPIFGNVPNFGQLNQRQFNQPQFGQLGQPQFGTPNFGSTAAPNRWPYQGTGSNWLPSIDWTWPKQVWSDFQNRFLPRVLERPRARQTYLFGNNGNELNINDIELATTATIPNFMQSKQPLRITPGFIFHFWDGPDSVAHPGFDLPAQAYSTFLAFDHITDQSLQSGLESNLTVGYYSDFDNTSSDAIRLTGRLLGWSRINPYTVGKLGVEYFDRVDVKLLPAFGVYMTPNPDIKFDLFFPRTKLSHRIPNFADYEAWVYLGAEYGGGSWAIERLGGARDQADINDVRTFLGVEWMGLRRVTGFFEAGYVFDREIVYRSNALNKLELQDTFMIRSGLAF